MIINFDKKLFFQTSIESKKDSDNMIIKLLRFQFWVQKLSITPCFTSLISSLVQNFSLKNVPCSSKFKKLINKVRIPDARAS